MCNICPSKPSFSNYGNRNKHISEVHNGVYYECDRCGMVYIKYTYNQKIGVQRHKKNKHPLLRFYCNKCDNCSQGFSFLNDEKRHAKEICEKK